MRGSTQLAGAALVAVTLAAGGSAALAAPRGDPTGGYDIRDILGRNAHDLANLPTQEEAQGRPITFSVDVTGIFSTNAGPSPASDPNDAVATAYVTPAFSVDVTPVTLSGWSVGGGMQLDGDYYGGSYNNRFGEARAEAFAFGEHTVGPGTFTAEAVYIGFFNNDFTNHQFNLYIGDLDYGFKLGPAVKADISAEYEGSEIPELRRTRVNGTLAYTVPQKAFGYELILEADAAWGHFDAGANSGRNDGTFAGVMIAEKKLGNGWSLEWEGAYVNRQSNRAASRFDALELVGEIGKRF
jgi:hypothetical protein